MAQLIISEGTFPRAPPFRALDRRRVTGVRAGEADRSTEVGVRADSQVRGRDGGGLRTRHDLSKQPDCRGSERFDEFVALFYNAGIRSDDIEGTTTDWYRSDGLASLTSRWTSDNVFSTRQRTNKENKAKRAQKDKKRQKKTGSAHRNTSETKLSNVNQQQQD